MRIGSSIDVEGSARAVAVNVRRETFAVTGSTLDHLRRAVAMLAPRRAGAAHAAYTAWEVRWSYSPAIEERGFCAADVRVDVDVVCTFPRWRPPSSAAGVVVHRWIAYVEALEVHEQGHVDLAVQAAVAVHQALQTLAVHPSARALQRAAEEVAGAVLDDFRGREAAYDVATGRGAHQGVCLDGDAAGS